METQTTMLAIFLLITTLCYICFKFLRMMPTILRNLSCILEVATQVLQKSSGTFRFKGPWLCGFDFLITSDVENIRYILNKNHLNYHKGSDFKQIMEPFGDGIFVANSDWWEVQSTIIHGLITNQKFAMAVEKTMDDKILNGLFVILDHASECRIELDMQEVFQRLTFDITCKLALGFNQNFLSIEFSELPHAKAIHTIEEVILFRHLVPGHFWRTLKWLQIGIEKRMKQAMETFDHFVFECLSKKREQISKQLRELKLVSGEEDQDFDIIKCFLIDDQERNANLQALKESDKFLRDTIVTLLTAGIETVASGLSWSLWLIITHPSIEEKILEEIKTNASQTKQGNKFQGIFNEKELNKLVYLHGAICESLRLYPPVPYNHVVSIGADTLPSGHHINKNTRIIYCPYAMGRMEAIWGKDCLEFKPERWISQRGNIKHIPSCKFLAFNSGPRICLGKSLALQEMKAIIAAVIWNYSIKLVENHPVHLKSSMILHMKYGLKVNVSKRNATSME